MRHHEPMALWCHWYHWFEVAQAEQEPHARLVRRGALRQLVAHGSPLGAASESEYPAATVQLESGDAILWFTDGVTECENLGREQFTERRLRALFQGAALTGPERIRDAITEAIRSFSMGQPLADDVTFVVACVE